MASILSAEGIEIYRKIEAIKQKRCKFYIALLTLIGTASVVHLTMVYVKSNQTFIKGDTSVEVASVMLLLCVALSVFFKSEITESKESVNFQSFITDLTGQYIKSTGNKPLLGSFPTDYY